MLDIIPNAAACHVLSLQDLPIFSQLSYFMMRNGDSPDSQDTSLS